MLAKMGIIFTSLSLSLLPMILHQIHMHFLGVGYNLFTTSCVVMVIQTETRCVCVCVCVCACARFEVGRDFTLRGRAREEQVSTTSQFK